MHILTSHKLSLKIIQLENRKQRIEKVVWFNRVHLMYNEAHNFVEPKVLMILYTGFSAILWRGASFLGIKFWLRIV